jgi:hypothetical protein
VELRHSRVPDEEIPERRVLFRHGDRRRTEIKTDILLDTLFQQHRRELARTATDLEHPTDARAPQPICDDGPEEIVKRAIIRLFINIDVFETSIIPIGRFFRIFLKLLFGVESDPTL